MEYICGVTFAPFACAGAFFKPGAKESLAMMKERTGANFVIFVPGGLQETPQSEEICFTSKATMEDDELIAMIEYAKEIGLRVALKPTVNCKNGTWRAHNLRTISRSHLSFNFSKNIFQSTLTIYAHLSYPIIYIYFRTIFRKILHHFI